MADRHFHRPQTLDEEVVHLFGIVTLGADAVTSQTSHGFTVTKTGGAGQFTITLADKYPELLGCFVQYEDSAATADREVRVDGNSMSAGTIGLEIVTSSTGAAAASLNTSKIHIHIVLKNSTRLP